ncbi:protein YELLOW LEAF 1, choloroplastic-like [Lotus japonicus]|uniref:protein YELLOW LEAF 1, choloroplastic-like n=1 Tax=Lotus japonicus TaxID=34305 RepID=UPI00258CB0D4|nr:protein YELLOW LEAF 1, choloroplastic-like [Lotus japonicus]XP_057433392.1 protein YELLOW LEAF 1, choloroplastic-like [Lotus japonicus]XP_057433393.1 protein YELLOW LEAF 1, choloroplastic-like [Lotus japonicus]
MESCVASSPRLLPVTGKIQSQVHVKGTGPNIVGMPHLPFNIRKEELRTSTFKSSSRGINAKCAASASATQVLKRNDQKVIVPGKHDPKIDDNGPTFPPRDNHGNGDNGGGGDKFSGGLTLLGVLGVLDVLKDVESEWRKKEKISFELEN